MYPAAFLIHLISATVNESLNDIQPFVIFFFWQKSPLRSDPAIKYSDKIQSNPTLLIFFLRIYSDMFRLLEAIFRLNIKECIYIYITLP